MAMDTNRRAISMAIDPKVSSEARGAIVRLVDKLVARSQRGFILRGERVMSDLKDIAQDDLQSNLPGVRGAYLAVLRLTIDATVYEALLDGPLYIVAYSAELEELAQIVADQAGDLASIVSSDVEAKLTAIAEKDLGAGITAARGAFLAQLEARLPHHGDTYDELLAGPLSFLASHAIS